MRPAIRFFAILAMGCCLLTLPAVTSAAEGQPEANEVTFKTDRVIVFKDGYALFVKHGTAVADDIGNVYTEEVPNAVLGTVWARTDNDRPVNMRADVVESRTTETAEGPAQTLTEVLRANERKSVTLILDNEQLSGVLEEVLERPAELQEEPIQYLHGIGDLSSSIRPILPPNAPATLVAIRLASGETRVLPISMIRQVAGPELSILYESETVEISRAKRLTFEMGDDLAGQEVNVEFCYFTNGVQWIPTYRLDGDLEADADLFLQGEILNEVEDIIDADVHLIVGVPHFRFKGQVSPLSLESNLRQVFNTLAGANMMNNAFSNSTFTSQAIGMDTSEAGVASIDASQITTGEGRQDLYVYTLEDVTLHKGSRGARALHESTVTPKHIYRLDAGMKRGTNGYAGESGEILKVNRNQVWHTIEFLNESDGPWTTGPILIIDDGFPIGQDRMTYTPSGGKARLPLTIAVDVHAVQEERETSREPNAIVWRGHQHTQVEKTGTIKITSFRSEDSAMEIRFDCGGKLFDPSDDANVVYNDYRSGDWEGNSIPALNQHSTASWSFTLPAGETKELSYKVSFYVQ